MKVIDFETTGLNEFRCSIVEAAGLDIEHPDRVFHKRCRIWNGAEVEPKALEINGFTMEQITDPRKITDEQLIESLVSFFGPKIFVSGSNPMFDARFGNATAKRYLLPYEFLDDKEGNLQELCYNHRINRGIPNPKRYANLKEICDYCGLPPDLNIHRAENDVVAAAECLNRFLYGKPLFKELRERAIPDYLKR